MPNTFAFIVLFSFPIVVIVLFRRLPLEQALIWSILSGYLFLPELTEVDLPLLPALDKTLVPSLMAGIMCLMAKPHAQLRRGAARPQRGAAAVPDSETVAATVPRQSKLANLCILVLFIAPVGIVMTNADWVNAGIRMIAGLRTYDIFSMMLSTAVMLLPFLLARRYLNTHEAHMRLLWALVIGALVYSLLILVEIRLSPQLHRWLYGFHAHQFGQQVRGDGFRPMVFIQHGLRVGLFILLAVIAAFTLYRIHASHKPVAGRLGRGVTLPAGDKGLPFYVACYLFVILILCKTLGALAIACIFVPFMLLAKPHQWRYLAAAFAFIVLLYPMVRSAGLAPVEQIHELALAINEERAQSFKFRLDNEDILLARAAEKPLLGWGGWGRNLLYSQWDGRVTSVPDGMWVIIFGVSGWVGYLAQFGLLTLPIFAYFFSRGELRNSIASQGLCLILVANLIDLIPNSGLTPLTWLLAGALLGRFERRPHVRDTKSVQRATLSTTRDGQRAPAAARAGSRRAF
ncbi:O-antigen ligase family protein [Yoonia sp. F2084L]|uniref:O-antigen ligase family protein n=1 Tax=Yoonia sp. F2084L TaxID=2926419 RepID=UPI001FF35BEB|nr:O-antigen ligase family protein [Yoonia sp. F2084L]MCK0093980.1 O-antigen ligase family protein [Yoonia sp. F2084L]